MKLHVHHQTVYQYEVPCDRSIQYLRLRPPSTRQQKILEWNLDIPGDTFQLTDGFGNNLIVMTLEQPVASMTLTASGVVELTGRPLTDHDSPLAPEVFLRSTTLTTMDDDMAHFARSFGRNKRSLTRLMRAIGEQVTFLPGSTTVNHTASQAFAQGSGVCQDHTHIFIACCRHLGVPARYISGYVHSTDPNHLSTHAWAEVYLGQSWHTFDVVNNKSLADNHIKLAVGLDYRDAAPVRGIRSGGGEETLASVAHVYEQ